MSSNLRRGRRTRVLVVIASWAVVVPAAGAAASDAPDQREVWGSTTRRVSVSTTGQQANYGSFESGISEDGRYVAFASNASNLVDNDTNPWPDIFLRDGVRHVTLRVSVGPHGRQGTSSSTWPAISADGRYIAFTSNSWNLVAGDTNQSDDIFVRDRKLHVTGRVSVGPHGRQANGYSFVAAISANGRYVAFDSNASNLVAGDTNRSTDVFVRDRARHVTRRVSVSTRGHQANLGGLDPAISADGRYVVFVSPSNNLVTDDTNGHRDVFVRDRKLHVTRRVSVGPHGRQANRHSYDPAISAGGRYVAFGSRANDLVTNDTNGVLDVFIRDLKRRTTERISVGPGGQQANDASGSWAMSGGGRYVAFGSDASNLVPGDSNDRADVFLRDRAANQTSLVSVSSAGVQGNATSDVTAVSADGQHIAFVSSASNLVNNDTNHQQDAFVRDR